MKTHVSLYLHTQGPGIMHRSNKFYAIASYYLIADDGYSASIDIYRRIITQQIPHIHKGLKA